jgi:DNA-directed RNA polymerase specialized sigma24 family protein
MTQRSEPLDLLIADIEAELPELRRFARMLIGSQPEADTLCCDALSALFELPDLADGEADVRLELYRALHAIWGERPADAAAPAAAEEPAALHHLLTLNPLHREILLLAYVADFALEEIAAVLGVERPFAERLLTAARAALQKALQTRVLIIEDEGFIAWDLSRIVESMDHQVIGIARTADEARLLAARERPGLILADLRLADGSSGLQAVRQLGEQFAGDRLPAIFITAHPDDVGADEAVRRALVAKPFTPSAVQRAIANALLKTEIDAA